MEWLQHGQLIWGNPSSHHSSGKQAKKAVQEVEEFLLELFGLKDTHYLVFHSGATEGINTIIQGFFRDARGSELAFVYSPTDHSAVTAQLPFLQSQGVEIFSHKIEKGHVLFHEEFLSLNQKTLMNWTWVNNETGIVWPLDFILQYKKKSQLFIHVDAVQAVPRIPNFSPLEAEVDYYTFSGHKFGALKGIGFSFLKKGSPFIPLLLGGGQQGERRSGTENLLGIISLKLALMDVQEQFHYESLQKNKRQFEQELKLFLGDQGQIVGEEAPFRNVNTITFLFRPKRSDMLLAALDMAGIEVGRGSACSLGQTQANPVLMATGLTAEESKRTIRLSFSPYWKEEEFKECFHSLKNVLQRFITHN